MKGKVGEPVAVETCLGWVLSGPMKEPNVLKEYDKIIGEQLNSGVIEEVAELERKECVHYLPHQAVIRRGAKTTRLRVIYDASSKEWRKGTSLNDCLHVGPSLTPMLYDILGRIELCCRRHRKGFSECRG